jgi:hypothetical protein
MDGPPGLDDIMAWFPEWPNLGLVCGAVSDRLVMVEFEGRFMEHFTEAARRLEAADLGSVWESWLEGYCERTPGRGLHILIHVGGDGPVPGNIKVASDGAHQTLIETRGEGGFVIIAPSNGSTHQSGGKWERISGSFDEIAWTTPEEFAAVLGVLASFNVEQVLGGTKSSPPPSSQRTFDGPGQWPQFLATFGSVPEELERRGWTQVGQDSKGTHWKRPGKPEPGHSGSVNDNGRLYVFSSSTPLTPSGEQGDRTYDTLDIILAYELGRTPTDRDRTDRFRQWKGGQYPPVRVSLPQASGGDSGEDEMSPPSAFLPPEFWSARPVFQAIHDAALKRYLSPDAVFGAFLSCYATTIPSSIVIPAIATAPSPLNTYCVLVARSGGGKTGAMRTALELLNWSESEHPDVRLDIGLRSGEGLITAACIPKTKDNPDPGYRQGIQVCFDEGGMLSRQSERSGATILPYLITAWAGAGTVGGYKAAESASFPASLVRVCAVIGIQYGAAANLFTGEAERTGFPQRLLFFGLDSPELDDIVPTLGRDRTINPVDVQFWSHGEFHGRKHEMQFPDHVELAVAEWTLRKTRHGVAALDGHKMLLQMRTASTFALWEGRGVVNDDDWELASTMCATSTALRSTLIRSLGDVSDERNRALGRGDNVRQEAADAAWLEDRVQMLAGHLLNAKDGLTRKELRSKLRNTARPRLDDILDHGQARGLIRLSEGRYWGGTP